MSTGTIVLDPAYITSTLIPALETVVFANEDGNNSSKLNTFTPPAGAVSTYSFGLFQFDVGQNPVNVQGFLSSDIKTGKQRAWQYFLGPLLETGDESLRER